MRSAAAAELGGGGGGAQVVHHAQGLASPPARSAPSFTSPNAPARGWRGRRRRPRPRPRWATTGSSAVKEISRICVLGGTVTRTRRSSSSQRQRPGTGSDRAQHLRRPGDLGLGLQAGLLVLAHRGGRRARTGCRRSGSPGRARCWCTSSAMDAAVAASPPRAPRRGQTTTMTWCRTARGAAARARAARAQGHGGIPRAVWRSAGRRIGCGTGAVDVGAADGGRGRRRAGTPRAGRAWRPR